VPPKTARPAVRSVYAVVSQQDAEADDPTFIHVYDSTFTTRGSGKIIAYLSALFAVDGRAIHLGVVVHSNVWMSSSTNKAACGRSLRVTCRRDVGNSNVFPGIAADWVWTRIVYVLFRRAGNSKRRYRHGTMQWHTSHAPMGDCNVYLAKRVKGTKASTFTPYNASDHFIHRGPSPAEALGGSANRESGRHISTVAVRQHRPNIAFSDEPQGSS